MQWSRKVFFIAMIAFIAVGLRLWRLDVHSITSDEAYSYFVAQHSVREILVINTADTHPPLYYLLLHGWLQLHDSVYGIRLLSVLSSLGTMAILWHVGRKLFGKSQGYWPVIVYAGLFIARVNAQTARPYALVEFAGVVSLAVLLAALRAPSVWRWIFYGSSILTAFLVDYSSVVYAPLHVAFVALLGREHWRPWILTLLAVALTITPYSGRLLVHMGNLSHVPHSPAQNMFLLPLRVTVGQAVESLLGSAKYFVGFGMLLTCILLIRFLWRRYSDNRFLLWATGACFTPVIFVALLYMLGQIATETFLFMLGASAALGVGGLLTILRTSLALRICILATILLPTFGLAVRAREHVRDSGGREAAAIVPGLHERYRLPIMTSDLAYLPIAFYARDESLSYFLLSGKPDAVGVSAVFPRQRVDRAPTPPFLFIDRETSFRGAEPLLEHYQATPIDRVGEFVIYHVTDKM